MPATIAVCRTCENFRRLRPAGTGRCRVCRATDVVHGILDPAPALHPLRDVIIKHLTDRVLEQLADTSGEALRALAAQGDVSFEQLERFEPKVSRRLIAECQAAGLLGPIIESEQTARHIERALAANQHRLDERDVQAIRRYGRWIIIRRDRSLESRDIRPTSRAHSRRECIAQAIAFCAALHAQHLSLKTCTSYDLSQWLNGGECRPLLAFLRWGHQQKLVSFYVESMPKRETRTGEAPGVRAELRSRLLHDEAIPLMVRVAGLLIYRGFNLLEVTGIKLCDVIDSRGHLEILLGTNRYLISADVARLIRKLIATREALMTKRAREIENIWLFPGRSLGRSISRDYLWDAFRRIGMKPRASRNGFFLRVGQNMPQLVAVSRTFGHCYLTVANWRKASGDRRMQYVAQRYRNQAKATVDSPSSPVQIDQASHGEP